MWMKCEEGALMNLDHVEFVHYDKHCSVWIAVGISGKEYAMSESQYRCAISLITPTKPDPVKPKEVWESAYKNDTDPFRKRWSNRPGIYSIECYRDEAGMPWASMSGPDVQLPDELAEYLMPWEESQHADCPYETLVLEFVSSGYTDPGIHTLSNGDPGYPPEHCDDRDVRRATCNGRVLPNELRDKLAEMFSEQIDEVEIN